MKDPALGTITRYASSHLYRQVLNLFSSFLRPKLLSAEHFGLWNLLSLIPSYSSYLHFGSYNTARFSIPYHRGKNEEAAVGETVGSALGPSLALNSLVAAGVLMFAFKGGQPLEVRLGLVAMAALTMLTWVYNSYRLLLKSFERFNIIASSHYFNASVVFILTVALLPPLRIYGVYLVSLLSTAAVIVYLRRRFALPGQLSFSFSRYASLVERGIPIMMISNYAPLMRSGDKFVVALILGREQLGYFGLAAMVIGFLTQIPGVSREVLEPRMMRSLDGNGSETVIGDYFLQPLFNSACYMPFLVGPVYFLVEPVTSLLLPRYGQAVWPAKILALGMYFTALTYVFRGIIVVLRLEREASVHIVLTMTVQLIISVSMALSGFGIAAVAVGSSISSLLLLLALSAVLYRRCAPVRREAGSIARRVLEPTVGFLFLLAVLEFAGRAFPSAPYATPLLQTSLFLFGAYALVGVIHRRNPLVARLTPRQILRRPPWREQDEGWGDSP